MIEEILTFMYVGLMAIGGGLVTIPILIQTVVEKGWITLEEFYNIVSISEATPGPIGLNISTYIGYARGGILLAIIASISLIIPSFIFVYIVARAYNKYKENKYVKKVFKGLRATVAGLIVSTALGMYKIVVFNGVEENIEIGFSNFYKYIDYLSILGIVILFALQLKFKGNVIKYIFIGGIIGILFYYI